MESQPNRVNPDQRFFNFESAYEFYNAPASAPPPPPSPLYNVPNNYTNEDVQSVSRILTCDNNYQILGVNESSSCEEIRMAYTNVLEKVHPNFNKAPGSVEAFMKAKDAYESLIQSNGQKTQNKIKMLLFGLGTALVIFLLFYYAFYRPDAYEVEVSGDYNMPMKTKECGIEFYVKSVDGFDTKYPVGSQKRTHIEKDIVHDFVYHVRNNHLCQRENHVHLQYPNTPTPNCDKLKCLGRYEG